MILTDKYNPIFSTLYHQYQNKHTNPFFLNYSVHISQISTSQHAVVYYPPHMLDKQWQE